MHLVLVISTATVRAPLSPSFYTAASRKMAKKTMMMLMMMTVIILYHTRAHSIGGGKIVTKGC